MMRFGGADKYLTMAETTEEENWDITNKKKSREQLQMIKEISEKTKTVKEENTHRALNESHD
jgi:hypothetical protein